MTPDRFSREFEGSGRKQVAARQSRLTAWRYATLLGACGWRLVVPVRGGSCLRRWLDVRHVGSGQSCPLR